MRRKGLFETGKQDITFVDKLVYKMNIVSINPRGLPYKHPIHTTQSTRHRQKLTAL